MASEHRYETSDTALPGVFLFLLPTGRPRAFFSLDSCTFAIQAGGRPLRLAPPSAKRSRLRIASPNCSRSRRSSARILLISIAPPNQTVRARHIQRLAATLL